MQLEFTRLYTVPLSNYIDLNTTMVTTTTVTFIRHGESEDNLKAIWAGWKDSPLSELGRRQARALGSSLSSTHITHFYTSPLLRAFTTAQFALHNLPDPKPALQLNYNLREQNFGMAEGHPWTRETVENMTPEELYYRRKIFPIIYERSGKFPDGESLDDLALRAEVAIRECILPHVQSPPLDLESESPEIPAVHVAIASHGLCISELVSALLRLDPEANVDGNYRGLLNTAWTRVEIRVRDGHHGPIDPADPPPLEVRVTHFNQKGHLESLEIDPTPTTGVDENAKSFFGGVWHY